MRRQEDFDPGHDAGREPPAQPPAPPGGINPKWIVSGVLILLLVVFAVANSRRVQVNFLVTTTEARVVTVIIVSGLIGFLAGWFVGRPGRAERKAMQRGMSKD